MNCNKLSPEKLIKLAKEDIERTKKGIKTNLKFLDIVNKKIERSIFIYIDHLWSKQVQIDFWKHPHPENIDDNKEPYINFALCLVYEIRLYFRNWGAELQICIHKYLDNLHEQIQLKEQEIEDTKTCMKWISGGEE